MRISQCFAVAAAVAVACASPARGEFCNCFCRLPSSVPGGGETSFSITYQGNIIQYINLNAMQSDEGVNAYAYVNKKIVGSGTSTATAKLDSKGNTVVTFSGSNPILASYEGLFKYPTPTGTHAGSPHFGLDASAKGSPPSPVKVLSETWSSAPNSTDPVISIFNRPATGSNLHYVTFFADVTANGITSGYWYELPYTTGISPKLTITNDSESSGGGVKETLSNVGYYLTPTEIPLDNLNFITPPPGSPGSPFTSLPLLDGAGLNPDGGSISTNSLPEPSSVITLGTGILIAAGYLGRRHVAGRRRRVAGAF